MTTNGNNDNIRDLVMQAIQNIAPEITESDIDPDEDLREECDLDSMDFLNLLDALKRSCGVSIPESDYPQIRSFSALVNYLNART
ncbi:MULTISPECIES: acyl carrier protein [Photobacterium]|uniref:Phosphopantetheine-binding protein n=1 Tax=Photobacterium ganghwense TaxID=320778 RepID=A0A0J1H9B1_9GAMM|nr:MULTISPECIES: acyl carrier protein [Photobacterium]KLV08283.1 phosphopantetheine-binding protein [Photobacterium ganghwense]MBV1842914.1 acyl carrier protein [Photobacterium ganghwense]PSU07416.1 acyl carrier protein [Photobacterium ganghwense]QSV16155.1 acyl carrier protein [Photobacterium ganghwense]